jgi:hypothetical protein
MAYHFGPYKRAKRQKTDGQWLNESPEAIIECWKEAKADQEAHELWQKDWHNLQDQGWRCGPRLMYYGNLSNLSDAHMSLGYGFIRDNQLLFTWKAHVLVDVQLVRHRNALDIQTVHFKQYSDLFNVFNIQLDPAYVHQVILTEFGYVLKVSYFSTKPIRDKLTKTVIFKFPFQIRQTEIPTHPTWAVGDRGCVSRISRIPGAKSERIVLEDGFIDDIEYADRISNGFELSGHFPDSYIPLNACKNLRPCLVHFVLRYLMIVYSSDSPILEAVFETWPGKLQNTWCDTRLFPAVKLPQFYKWKKGDKPADAEIIY